MPDDTAIPCELDPATRSRIRQYADDLKQAAHTIGSHGMTAAEFENSGLFGSAIERLRGQQSATMGVKKQFIDDVLAYLQSKQAIRRFAFTGAGDRHDYSVTMPNGKVVVIEAKGCLDGNNTNIFQRPSNAEEFFIWSLCQNAGADPEKNAWSGIHTRLGATILAEKQAVDGLIIWDMLCGTLGRPCPKIQSDQSRFTSVTAQRKVPPPCMYLFPVTVPDARNNPSPRLPGLADLSFAATIYTHFKCRGDDVTYVGLEARMAGADVQRRTTLSRGSRVVRQSDWTNLKRASL